MCKLELVIKLTNYSTSTRYYEINFRKWCKHEWRGGHKNPPGLQGRSPLGIVVIGDKLH